MFATMIALIVGVLLFVVPQLAAFIPDPQVLAILMAVVASFCLPLLGMINILPLIPLQKAEAKITPRVVGLFRRDRSHGWMNLMLILFPIFSYGFFFFLFGFADKEIARMLFAVWLLFFGVVIDRLRAFFLYFSELLDPYCVIDEYGVAAHALEDDGDVEGTCEWLGALSETGTKAIHRNSMTLVSSAIDEMSDIAQEFLQKWKRRESSLAMPLTEEKLEEQHYPLYFLLQRMEFLYDQALEKKLEPICTSVVTNLGKIVATAVRCGVPVDTFALHVLGQCAQAALKQDLEEVAVKASCTLEQVTKILAVEPEIAVLDLKSPFLAIISQMDSLAKELFRRDKNINVGALSHPFHEMKELFQQEPLLSHPDHDVILGDLDRVIGEYVALEQVMLGKARMEEPSKEE